jgi:uncharacterized membrane protein
MAEPRRGWGDVQVEQLLGNLLRAGVFLAAAVVLAGGVVYLTRHGGEPRPDLRKYREDYEPPEMRRPTLIAGEAFGGGGRGLVQLGLLLLIATPVARVVFSIFAFALERDYIYAVLTLLVLGVLLYSLFLGG